MFLRLPLVSLFSRPRHGSPTPSSARARLWSWAAGAGIRPVRVLLAIYLIPALFVVLLVGAVGLLVLSGLRIFGALLDATSDAPGTRGTPGD
jgi:hypothetical protein